MRSAIVLAVLIGPVLGGGHALCGDSRARRRTSGWWNCSNGLRRHWRHGIVLGAALAIAVAAGAVVVPFYARAGTWAWPLAGL